MCMMSCDFEQMCRSMSSTVVQTTINRLSFASGVNGGVHIMIKFALRQCIVHVPSPT